MTTTTPRWAPESVLRTARKPHLCRGAGGGGSRKFAPGHHDEIKPGERYLEYLGETPAYQSGTAHCMACALAFYTDWEERWRAAEAEDEARRLRDSIARSPGEF